MFQCTANAYLLQSFSIVTFHAEEPIGRLHLETPGSIAAFRKLSFLFSGILCMTKKRSNTSSPSKPSILKTASSGVSPDVDNEHADSFFSKTAKERKRDERIGRYAFSFFSILIFIIGSLCGAYFLSDVFQDSSGKSGSAEFLAPARPVLATSEPEDFYPASEFRKQSAIFIGCQKNLFLDPQLYGDIAKAIDRKVPLFGVVNTEVEAQAGVKIIKDLGLPPDAMRFIVLPSNSMWIRDYAPLILRFDNERAVMVDAKYNSRTMREQRKEDDFMGLELARLLGLSVRSVPLLLEGGNLISNGDGLLLTSAKTLDVNLEAEFTQKQLMNMFFDYFGVHTVYTVGALFGEPNGHTDMFMTMLDKNLAVIAEVDPSVDPENSARLDENAEFVASLNTSSGPIKVVRIPMPPKWGEDWRSYTNIILANGVLLMPSFSDVDPVIEDRAEQVYRSALPNWEVKRINCDKLVKLQGQLHCISYNIPHFVSMEGIIKNSHPKIPEVEL